MIANLPPSPLCVSELGKCEDRDLTPEVVTAKNEHVPVSHGTEGTVPGPVAVNQQPRESPRAQHATRMLSEGAQGLRLGPGGAAASPHWPAPPQPPRWGPWAEQRLFRLPSSRPAGPLPGGQVGAGTSCGSRLPLGPMPLARLTRPESCPAISSHRERHCV